MSLNNLTPATGSTHKGGKRVGRGEGSGKGGTAARGHKGAKSRSGYSKKLKTALKVEAHKFSAEAQKAIEAAGGEVVTL